MTVAEMMNEERARGILTAHANSSAFADRGWVRFTSDGFVQLDGEFSADFLDALAWWLRNKPGEHP
jgi:hypothetical protein